MKIFTRIRRLFAGYDTYERHRLVSSQVDNSLLTILDVGGGKGQLGFFCDNPVTVLNLHSGDIIGNGLNIPFNESSFDIVVSIDVLEHIQKQNRAQFIEELLRVGSAMVIFCTPFGSIQHERIEKESLDLLSQKGISDIMLTEHVKYGLPTVAEIKEYIPEHYQINLLFSGDFRFNIFVFKIAHWMGSRFRILKAMFSLIINLLGNLIIYPMTLSSKPLYNTNRTLVVIKK